MANLITRIIRKIIPQQERRCPACKRTLQRAIDDQLKDGCGCPLEHCAFKREIRQVILESKTPEVILWNVDRINLFENEAITLSWEVLYAKKISISGLGEVPLKDNRTISPIRDTTYTLTIEDWKNNEYEVEQKISVKVTPLPIVVFQSDKNKIEIGDTVTFSWTARHTSKVELSDGNLTTDVTNRTDYLVQLTGNTTFKLIATALDNHTTIEREISVEVFPKPKIEYFKVNPEVVLDSMPVTLSWKVENAKKVEINNGVGEVVAEGEKVALYKENTLYTITAVGELSTVFKNVVVKVFPTPIIESLLVPMPDFESRINLSSIKITAPTIDVKINMPDFITTPHITAPSIKLSDIKPEYKPYKLLFNFQRIYVYVRRKTEQT
jgi:plastocyanin